MQTVKWYNSFVVDNLSGDIIIPKIYRIIEGEVLSVVYFEFLDLKKIKSSEIERELIKISLKLHHSHLDRKRILSDQVTPKYILNFALSEDYKTRLRNVIKRTTGRKIDWEAYQDSAANSRQVIAHGDLQEFNVFKNAYLIDWDFCGIRPIGYDVAFAYFSLIIRNNVKNFSISWLDAFYKSQINKNEWTDFERNFFFFLYLFFIWRFNKKMHLEIEEVLIQKLREIQSKI